MFFVAGGGWIAVRAGNVEDGGCIGGQAVRPRPAIIAGCCGGSGGSRR